MAKGKRPSRQKTSEVSTRDNERDRLTELVEDILEEKGAYIAEVVQRSFSFSGPLPPPELLAHYDEIVPGLAERIVRMAEKEQDHRHGFEKGVLRIFGRGQLFGFILGLIALGLGTYLIAIGEDAYGVGMMIAAIATLAGSLFFGRRRPRPDKKKGDTPKDAA